MVVILKVTDFAQAVVDSLFLKELLKLNEFDLFEVILGQASLGNHHVLMRVAVLELYDFPVVWVEG